MWYAVVTKDSIFRTKRKLDAIFKHVTFRYKDKARFREMSETQMKTLERSNKRVIEI